MSNNEISWRLRDLAADDYQTPHEREVLILAADVLDAIPDKDDPVGWVQEVRAKRMGVPTPSEALQMQVTINRELQAEIDELRALRDAIPGDDKRLVAEWVVKITTQHLISTDRTRYVTAERLNALDALMDATDACLPSVRAALRGEA